MPCDCSGQSKSTKKEKIKSDGFPQKSCLIQPDDGLGLAERIGKAIHNPPRDVMLSHAAKEMGYG
jgi:hypothetical protein